MKAKTLADFRADHFKDVPANITRALAELRKIGPEHYEYELEFMRRSKISSTELGRYRRDFLDYVVVVGRCRGTSGAHNPRRVWFGDSKVAAKMRAVK